MTEISFRRAVRSEVRELTEIAFAAKRHWKYPEAWIEMWREGLTLTAEQVEEWEVFVLERAGKILGWIAFSVWPQGWEIEHFWVKPEEIGAGIGRELLERALREIMGQGKRFRVVSDPNAVGFYEKMGFRVVGTEASLPEGRQLPVMEMEVP